MGQDAITIIAVEDDADIRDLLIFNLEKEGYQALGAGSGEAALQLILEHKPALVLLDLMLPGMGGMALCRRIRQNPEFAATAILMLTAKGEESDIVAGLEAGADDYVVKPFSPGVLLARVRSLLRRGGGLSGSGAGGEKIIDYGDIVINPERREVLVAGNAVDLTTTEFKILHCLARRPGIVFTRGRLLDLVHGDLHAVTDRAVDVQIVGLRRKLGPLASVVETVRGAGYRFADR